MKSKAVKDCINKLKETKIDKSIVLRVGNKRGYVVGEFLCAEDGQLTLIHQVVNHGRGWESTTDIPYKDITTIDRISAVEVLKCLSEILLQWDVATRRIDPATMK